MFIITGYELEYKEEFDVYWVIPSDNTPPCPYCGGKLHYRDSRRRICRIEGGGSVHLMVRRLRCENCHTYHTELPDCLVPYKHYGAETISGVIDGVVTPDDPDSEDYPCAETMKRWLQWFKKNRENMNGALRKAGYAVLGLGESFLFTATFLLDLIRNRYQDWLERTLRIIYNSGGALAAGP